MANRFVLNTISYHGSGAIKEIPGELQRRGYKKIFVCSDPDLVKFGVTAKVTDELDAAGIAWSLYSEIKPNPTIQNVKDGVEAFKAAEADAIVTIGGGSSMDTAKAIGIIINNPEFADVRSLEDITDEPGIYETDEVGIRIENELECIDLGDNQYGHWLGFAPLTLVPIDTAPVLVDELSRDQITWLNNYHAHVYEMLSPRLTEDEKVWLKNKCASIGR